MFSRIRNMRNVFRNTRRAVILLITMWMAVVLSMIAYSLSYELQMEVKLVKLRKDSVSATAMARAGAAKAIVDLKNDLLFEFSDGLKRKIDAEGDVWKRPEDGKKDMTAEKDDDAKYGFYNVKVVDENSKIDLNKAPHEVIQYALMMYDIDEEEASDIANMVIDWRDSDDKPADGSDGTEGLFYAELEAKKDGGYFKDDLEPVKLKNDVFNTVEELMEIPGITSDVFYGTVESEKKKKKPARMSDTKKRYLLSSRERYMKEIRKASEEEFFDEENHTIGMKDIFTVKSDGNMNINTASKAALTVLACAAAKDLSSGEDVADQIIKYRRNNRKDDIDNDQAFHDKGELAKIGVDGGIISKMQSFQPFSVLSTHFLIISQGQCGEVKKTLRVLVSRTMENFNLDDAKVKEKVENRKFVLRNFRNIKKDKKEEGQIFEPAVRIINWMEQ